MENKRTKICFVNGTGPNFLGGISLYQKNLIKYIKSRDKNVEITLLYKSDKYEKYEKEGINYLGIKTKKILFIDDILFNKKCKKYLEENYFNIINSHAIYGYWMKNYKRGGNQKIIHTYHGAGYSYYKVHLRRFGLIKKIFLSPLLLYSYLIEKPPIKKADKIICVSEKVKRQIENTYSKRKNLFVIRTGVNLKEFKLKNKSLSKKELNLEKDKVYGLYVARGGYWIKGLDRAVNISEEIYKINNNYRLIVIGAEYKKVKNIIKNKRFLIFLKDIPREKMNHYYSASDLFFCLSRYEGGAPTLVTSEAMASGCPVICSKDSEQEIIKNGQNGLIIEKFDRKDAEIVINLLNDKRREIIKNAIETIKKLSLEKWGEKYMDILK
jgi:glycosyltransferase involved in cell wall biosynthesis